MHFRLWVDTAVQLEKAIECSVDCIYAPIGVIEKVGLCEINLIRMLCIIPPVFIGGREYEIEQRLLALKRLGYTRALAHTIGHIPLIRDAGLEVYGNFRLNITNSVALNKYSDMGLSDCILSIELSLMRMNGIVGDIPFGFIGYGRLPTMILKRPILGNGLVDRKGKFSPIIKGENESELLNPDTLILSDKIDDFSGFDFAVLKLSQNDEPQEILKMYKNKETPTGNFTRGLYYGNKL